MTQTTTLWKRRHICNLLNDTCCKYCAPSERVAAEKFTTVLFKESLIFKHTPKKHKCSEINVYTLCDMSGYTWYGPLLRGQAMRTYRYDKNTCHQQIIGKTRMSATWDSMIWEKRTIIVEQSDLTKLLPWDLLSPTTKMSSLSLYKRTTWQQLPEEVDMMYMYW